MNDGIDAVEFLPQNHNATPLDAFLPRTKFLAAKLGPSTPMVRPKFRRRHILERRRLQLEVEQVRFRQQADAELDSGTGMVPAK